MRFKLLLCGAFSVFVWGSAASALPSLQLGPGAGNWFYDVASETWLTGDNPLELAALANATKADGGNGAYAWDQTSTTYAYLVVAAQPKTTLGADLFDITVSNDGGALALYTSGDGTPPLSDPLPPHGIYSTYFEIYEFSFDGPLTTIENTQPPGGDTGAGYKELFQIAVNSLAAGVTGLHFDLFTIAGAGHLNDTSELSANAPFSHDAGYVPEPGAVGVFSVGLLVAGGLIRRFRRSV
jgi:hypothetical protein